MDATLRAGHELAGRAPMFQLRFAGALLLRIAERQLRGLLPQLPPRMTRFEPANSPCPRVRPEPANGGQNYSENDMYSRAESTR